MPFISYAQNGEDVVLWRALGGPEPGFYVDVGAADPDEHSVTRAFYDRGWRGINVEPVPEMARRIAAARPRDVTLQVAAGSADGRAVLQVVAGTGLSTISGEVLASLGDYAARAVPLEVPLRRLAGLLDAHAPDRIDFLKIDVEGAERAVLEGCDFRRHRPRIVLLEATWPITNRPTHEDWETLLLAAGYHFALFDGLNRFYVADEWTAALGPRLAAPANVLDGYVLASTPYVAGLEAQSARAMTRAAAAEEAARSAYARGFEQARDVGELRLSLTHAVRERDDAAVRLATSERRNAELDRAAVALAARTGTLERQLDEASRLLDATWRSTSWRVTAPLRAVSSLARGRRPEDPAPEPEPAPGLPAASPAQAAEPPPRPAPLTAPAAPVRPIRTVHQFHSGSAPGDAVTNSMRLIRDRLRGLGYRSEIFVEHRDPALAGEMRLVTELPRPHPLRRGYLLIVHHSMGYDSFDRILAHAGPKLLYYHNVTPAALLPPGSDLPAYAELGREQLRQLQPHVLGAVAASTYNAIELRRLGFDPVWTSTLLFDTQALRAQAEAPPPRQPGHPFTVLFVGRVIESKGQADLVAAFGRFRAGLGRPARLVLAGRTDSPGTYLRTIDAQMRELGLEADLVLTGAIPDAELRARYAEADLYVSLSQHEGFGVPLMEAMAHGVPVLAWPAGAIAYTLAGAPGLLPSRDPADVADAMLAVAQDPARRAAMLAWQREALDRFALDRQWPAMQEALTFAGVAPARDPEAARTLAANLRFAILGHTEGSYSLAAVNRTLAASLEAERPGRVRLIPVEGAGRPLPGCASRLVARAAPHTGPELVISQHYPVLVPETRGDLTFALVFWEESLLPAATIATLNAGFDGVLAPSSFAAKALVDSGLIRPVHVIGHAPDLAPFEAIARDRVQAPRPGQPFTFLHVSSCFPRKGVDVLLAAYGRAFRQGDPVLLVIKGFPNPHNTVPEQVAALQRDDPAFPPVEVIDTDLDGPALHDLYRRADAMVLPTRGEGFNLPGAEAMAAGLPLIVTGFGGHLDFCGPETARLIAYRLASSESHLATGVSLWAEPDRDDVAAALREFEGTRRDAAAAARLHERTQLARVAVRERTSSRSMVRRLEHAALATMLRPPPTPVVIAWITSWAVRCGVAEYTRHLLGALPEERWARHVVLADDRSAAEDHATPPVRPAWGQADASTLPRLESAIVAEDPQVIVVQHQPGLMRWPMLAALLDSPAVVGRAVVLTLHNSRDLQDLPEPERGRLCAMLRRLSRVVVHSMSDLHRLQDLGIWRNVTLVSHGVRAALPRRAWRDAGATPTIGCYGFFLPGKGIGELIEGFALLRRARPGARLRLVNADYGAGASGEEIARCRQLAATLGLEDGIEWETAFMPDDESLRLLASCDVIVIPTQASREGSSAAVRMALAAGPPVLVTPLALFDELADAVVRADGTAPPDLAAGVDAVLADPHACGRVQAHAEAWLRARAWPDIARQFQGMLLGLQAAQEDVSG